MPFSRRRTALVAALLVPIYLGPYAYVFGMTNIDVFPRIEQLDNQAMDKLGIQIDDSIQAVAPQPRSGSADGRTDNWFESTYAFSVHFLNRIFPTYITFPALLDISRITFRASAVLNGTVIFTCSQYVDRLIAPTGFEAISFYGTILKAQNNTKVSIFCVGPQSPDDFIQYSQDYGSNRLPVLLKWSITATLKGEKLEATRTWFADKAVDVILP